jgi:hypothetical protein
MHDLQRRTLSLFNETALVGKNEGREEHSPPNRFVLLARVDTRIMLVDASSVPLTRLAGIISGFPDQPVDRLFCWKFSTTGLRNLAGKKFVPQWPRQVTGQSICPSAVGLELDFGLAAALIGSTRVQPTLLPPIE